jgi:hypothetical protein
MVVGVGGGWVVVAVLVVVVVVVLVVVVVVVLVIVVLVVVVVVAVLVEEALWVGELEAVQLVAMKKVVVQSPCWETETGPQCLSAAFCVLSAV